MTIHSDTVRTARHGRIGVVLVDNPPVNAIAPSVRNGIEAGFRELAADDAIDAIVLACAGKTFMAGADLRKLAEGPPPRPTHVINQDIEQTCKPTIAALQGNALGGGLEFALACHFRCASPDTKLGLPEVDIGLIPAAGGTQRLPRLVGVPRALEMIATGAKVDAHGALEIGLIDRLVEGDLLAGAMAFAEEIVRRRLPVRRLSEMAVPAAADGAAVFDSAIDAARRSRRGEIAPLEAIEVVRAATVRPFAEGIALEADAFRRCRESSQARALQHLFFAERQAAKLAHVAPSVRSREVRSVGVLGAGTMGRGIAISFADNGFSVVLVESTREALDRALEAIDATWATSVSKGRITADERDARRARLRGSLAMQDFANVDLVVEAVFEDLPLKRRIFTDLDRICRPGAILATNTSALDVDAIATATGRPADVVGLHFFSPANVMRLVEIVRGRATSSEVLVTAMIVSKSLRKLGVVAGNCDGFIGNRMLMGYRREAEFLLLEGATPSQVDRALTTFGMAMGPHAMGDLAGLDVSAAGRRRRRAEGRLPPDPRFGAVPDRLVELGRFGQKTAAGFYRYEPGSRTPLDDPEVERIAVEEAGRLEVERRQIDDTEIVERCILPLINEGARILEEGIAQRPSDVDVVYTSGYGFPRVRGGPMHYADAIGLDHVLAALRRLEQAHGSTYWRAAPLLERLAREQKTFGSLN